MLNRALPCPAAADAGKRLDEQDRGAFERERAAQEEADSKPIIELAYHMAGLLPGGRKTATHSHGTACRGSEYGDRFPRMFERFNGGKEAVWLQSPEFILIVVLLSVLVAVVAAATAQAAWLDPKIIY